MLVSVAASTRNCQRIVPLRGAERLPHADLPRPLGDRDHHDRHDADAAHHGPDRRQREPHQEDRPEHLVEDLEQPVLADEREVVRLRRAQPAAASAVVAVTSSITSSRASRRPAASR